MQVLTSGKAWEKFNAFITAHGGNFSRLLDPQFTKTTYQINIQAKATGYLGHIDALALGQAASLLGAGRLTKEDVIDPNAGIVLSHKIGAKLTKGQTLAVVSTNRPLTSELTAMLETAFTIQTTPVTIQPIVHAWIEA